jgi:galactoside O-acetyltransferase
MHSNKYKFKEIGKNVAIYEPVVIIQPEAMILKNNILFTQFCFVAGGSGLYVGNFTHFATHSSVSGGGYCILEDFVGVCAGVRIITGSDDINGKGIPTPTIPKELQSQFRSFYRSYVHCEKHVFLGTNSIVHPGITIGEGAVVGSGSVVTKNLEPWGVYLGSPAVRVRERPRERILELEQELYIKCSIEPETPTKFIHLAKGR